MVPTLLTAEIFKTLDYARARHACVLVQGRTGRGKTEAARAWCAARKNAYYIDCPPEGGLPALREAVRAVCSCPAVQDIADFLAGQKATLVLDECARILPVRGARAKALEWARRLHDQARVGLAFVATDFFIREASSGSLGEYLEQFIGRFRDKFIIPDYVSPQEAADILRPVVPDPADDLVQWAVKVANEPGKGGARRLWWLLDDAADIAAQRRLPVDLKFLQTVLKDYEGRARMPAKP